MSGLVWRRLHWPRPLQPSTAALLLRQLAAQRLSYPIIWEARASEGQIHHLIATPKEYARQFAHLLRTLVPDTSLSAAPSRQLVTRAARLRLSQPGLLTNINAPESAIRSVLTALTAARFSGELLVLQVVLGQGRPPRTISVKENPTITVLDALRGNHGTLPGHIRHSLEDKAASYNLQATARIGVDAPTSAKRQHLALGLLSALGTTDSAGTTLRLTREPPVRLNVASIPKLRWPLRLSPEEALPFLVVPLGTQDLPGLPPLHPRLIPASQRVEARERVFAQATAPGDDRQYGINIKDAMRGAVFLGPTGSGKSNALLHTIVADIAADRPLCIIDPKRDLITDILTRIPEHRRDDVVILDTTDETNPVGFNPLSSAGRNPEVVVDGIMTAMKDLFGGIGPRSQDILHASLITMIRTGASAGGHSLADLPRLLSDESFRRPLTASVAEDDVLSGFWAWYDGLTPEQAANVTAPLMNKLRVFLLRPQLRRILEQATPRFSPSQLFASNTDKDHRPKILLVPLNKGIIGPEAASLLGALLVAELWQCVLARATTPEADRTPVVITVDEVQDYLKIGDLADALSQSRSLAVGWQLAHQYRRQLSDSMSAAIEANCRSKITFALENKDATAMAALAPELEAIDFTQLGKHQIYANLAADGQPSGWASAVTLAPPPKVSDPDEIRACSRRNYGRIESLKPPPEAVSAASTKTNTKVATPQIGRRSRSQHDTSTSKRKDNA